MNAPGDAGFRRGPQPSKTAHINRFGVRHVVLDQYGEGSQALALLEAFAERHGGVLFRFLSEAGYPLPGLVTFSQ